MFLLLLINKNIKKLLMNKNVNLFMTDYADRFALDLVIFIKSACRYVNMIVSMNVQ